MKCPKCHAEMVLKKKDSSFNFDVKPKKKYERSIYWCKKDDIWVNVEVPSSNKQYKALKHGAF